MSATRGSRTAPLHQGQTLGGYRILGELGAGNMGAVLLARQLSMDRIVALKVLAPELVRRSPSFADQFVREAVAVAQFSHPNIIHIHDAGSLPGPDGQVLHYFAMEFVDGDNLDEILKRESALDPHRIGLVMSGMSAALAYAASKGMVHRDVKPANIMISGDEQVKLADFGLIRHHAEDGDRRIVGTPRYMSPEQILRLPVDYHSDQYSLGCTLFHLLTGEPPYLGQSHKEVMRAHVKHEIPDAREFVDCDPAWAELCARLMAKDPSQRYGDPQDLCDRVTEIIETTARRGPGAATGRRGRSRARTRKARVRQAQRSRSRTAPRSATTTARHAAGDRSRRPRPAVEGGTTRRSNRQQTRTARVIRSEPPPPETILIDEDDEDARSSRLAATLLWAPRLVRTLIVTSAERALTIGGAVLRGLWRSVIWILGHLIAMLPVIRALVYWAVPYLARIYFIPVSLTWRVRIESGRHHLLTAQDEDRGILAVVPHGRALPLVGRAIATGEQPYTALVRPWLGEYLARIVDGVSRRLVRLPPQRAQTLLRRLHILRTSVDGMLIPADTHQRDHCDDAVVALARTSGALVLPVACSATPGWIFRESPQHMLIPAPFATIHVAFGTPVEAPPGVARDLIARAIADELIDTRSRLDRLVGMSTE